jgi:hypothetical protein
MGNEAVFYIDYVLLIANSLFPKTGLLPLPHSPPRVS